MSTMSGLHRSSEKRHHDESDQEDSGRYDGSAGLGRAMAAAGGTPHRGVASRERGVVRDLCEDHAAALAGLAICQRRGLLYFCTPFVSFLRLNHGGRETGHRCQLTGGCGRRAWPGPRLPQHTVQRSGAAASAGCRCLCRTQRLPASA